MVRLFRTEPDGTRFDPARLYLQMAVPLGCLLVFLNAAFRGVPDELAHYYRALGMARGAFLPSQPVTAPANYVNLHQDLGLDVKNPPPSLRPTAKALRAALTTRSSAVEVPVPERVAFAYPTAFLPQALGLFIGTRTRAPPLAALYLARLLTLAAAIALIHAAIRSAPFGKLVFLLVGLLPTTLQQCASLSHDALHFGGVLFFTAQILALSQRNGVLSLKDRALALGLSLSGTILKPGYTMIACLVGILPRRLFGSSRAFWAFVIGAPVLGLCMAALGRLVFSGDASISPVVDPAEQVRHMFAHPLSFAGVVAQTLARRGWWLWEGIVYRSKLDDSRDPSFVYVATTLGLAVLLRSARDTVLLSWQQRLVLVGTGCVQGLLVLVSLYVLSTPLGPRSGARPAGAVLHGLGALLLARRARFRFRPALQVRELPPGSGDVRPDGAALRVHVERVVAEQLRLTSRLGHQFGRVRSAHTRAWRRTG